MTPDHICDGKSHGSPLSAQATLLHGGTTLTTPDLGLQTVGGSSEDVA